MCKGRHAVLVLAGLAVLALPRSTSAQQPTETLKNMLATQIRSQGFSCDKALKASKDVKRSKADHGVWVLNCSNASYRVSRAPDMAAKVELLP